MTPSLFVHGSAERIGQDLVSGNYFDVLGLKPYAGRLLHSYDETAPGADRILVLSYSFWKRRFAGDSGVVGSVISLNTTPMTIVGIAPPGFYGLRAGLSPDVYAPITMWPWMFGDESQVQSQRDNWFQFIVCRLKQGINRAQAEAAATTLYRNYTKEHEAGSPHFMQAADPLRLSLIPAATGLRTICATQRGSCMSSWRWLPSYCWPRVRISRIFSSPGRPHGVMRSRYGSRWAHLAGAWSGSCSLKTSCWRRPVARWAFSAHIGAPN